MRRLKPPARRAPRAALPRLLLMTDAARLPDPLPAVAALPAGAGVVLRERDARRHADLAAKLAAVCRQRRLVLLVAGDGALAQRVGADGVHWPEALLRRLGRAAGRRRRRRWLITAAAHSARALHQATRAGVDAVLLAPVFPTASHPGAKALGPLRFARLVRGAPLPVFALGGVDGARAQRLVGSGAYGFAAIGALLPPA